MRKSLALAGAELNVVHSRLSKAYPVSTTAQFWIFELDEVVLPAAHWANFVRAGAKIGKRAIATARAGSAIAIWGTRDV
jgi:hypothetical protein